ncbi:MAG TPA: hypothetical protein ENF80_01100 [Thermofilum sp.]|nr:hypothetical protein [Thermofilum sp.]
MVDPFKRLTVDFWVTDLHGEEIGIRQKEQYRSKSRYFTLDMDIIGKYKEDGKGVGFIALRRKIWEKGDLDGRLVIRMFTDEGRWLGSIEEVVSEEIKRSIGSNDIIPVFLVTIPKHRYVIWLEKVHRRLGLGEIYVFNYIDEKENKTYTYVIDEKRLTIGSDWEVYHFSSSKKSAVIDSKKLNIGGRVDIDVYSEEVAKNRIISTVIALFSSTLKYKGDIERRIRKRLNSLKDGSWRYKLDRGEIKILRNPRRILA